MYTTAVAFILALVTAAVLVPLVRGFALRANLLDQASSPRKIHERPVPRLGGLAIVAAFFVPFVALLVVETGTGRIFYENAWAAAGIFAGGALVAMLGIFDDVRGADARTKFSVQFAVAGLMYWFGFRIDQIANPFGEAIPLGHFGLLFTLLWIVGVVNALNLIDGLDGLAGGVALFAIGTTFVVALQNQNPVMLLFMASLGGAVLGFLFYNFNPASIFMGDTGSMFLGFILATSAIHTNQKSTTAVVILTPIVALGLPLLDTLLAIGRRAAHGRPLFRADQDHIHHRMVSNGLTHRQAALALYGLCVVLSVTAIALTYANSVATAVALALLLVFTCVFMRYLGYVQVAELRLMAARRRRNRFLRSELRLAAARLHSSETEQHVREAVSQFGAAVGAAHVRLRYRRSDDESCASNGPEQQTAAESAGFSVSFEVDGVSPGRATVGYTWSDGRAGIEPDEAMALESLNGHVADALNRVIEGSAAAPLEGPRALRRAAP